MPTPIDIGFFGEGNPDLLRFCFEFGLLLIPKTYFWPTWTQKENGPLFGALGTRLLT
jgi:hypothetical protein